MVLAKEEKLIQGIRLSSVGPAKVTGSDVIHEPTNMDLAMKLHYLRGVYYFNSHEVIEELTMYKIKETMFSWFNHFYETSGRFRRTLPSDGAGSQQVGRPYIKCNDCGVRFIEGKCVMTLNEWFEAMNRGGGGDADQPSYGSFHKQLVSDHVLGPELGFSPTVLMQITMFKCGGMSVGMSFAHVLGDVFSAAHFLNVWGQYISGKTPNPKTDIAKPPSLPEKSDYTPALVKESGTIKRIDPVGDHWIITNNCKMEMHSFHITQAQLAQLESKVSGTNGLGNWIGPFECICAIFWKSMAQIRDGSGINRVTVCRNGYPGPTGFTLSNNQIISKVEASFSIEEASLNELGSLLVDQAKNERKIIEQIIENDPATTDVIVYGANLTFADWKTAAMYDMEIKGQKPVFVNYSIDSIGDNGVILVLPGPTKDNLPGKEGRIVNVILPENEVLLLKNAMNREWSIV